MPSSLPQPEARRRRALPRLARSLFLIAPLIGASCSSVYESKPMISRDPATGEVALVRVTIEADARISDLRFRSDYVDAEAIDEVFKGQMPRLQRTDFAEHQRLVQMQQQVVDTAAAEVEKAYTHPPSPSAEVDIAAAERRLAQARSVLRRLRHQETTGMPEAPAERFVIAVSADPDAVFNELTAVAGGQDQQKSMLQNVQELARRAEAARTHRSTLAVDLWQQVVQPGESDAADSAETAAASETEAEAVLRRELAEHVERLANYLSIAP